MEFPLIVMFVVLYLVFMAWDRYDKHKNNYTFVKSDVDQREYMVQKAPDSKKAANHIAIIRMRLLRLKSYLIKKYPHDQRIQNLIARFDGSNIIENDTKSKFTSFTQNKGEKMVFCLRTRDKKNMKQLHDINTMMFVAIHELAHVISECVGHKCQEFWTNFAFLLREAMKIGVWKYVDFKKNPVEYCGMEIKNSVV
jgi:hypothetical protein